MHPFKILSLGPDYTLDDLRQELSVRAPEGEIFAVSCIRLERAIILTERRCAKTLTTFPDDPLPTVNAMTVFMAYCHNPDLRKPINVEASNFSAGR